MLYEFHRHQNSKQPRSIHATYLITGVRPLEKCLSGVKHENTDKDVPMQSSPLQSSSIPNQDLVEPQPKAMVMILVPEENLEGNLSFHIARKLAFR